MQVKVQQVGLSRIRFQQLAALRRIQAEWTCFDPGRLSRFDPT
jgi:hypothetical protein